MGGNAAFRENTDDEYVYKVNMNDWQKTKGLPDPEALLKLSRRDRI